MEGGPAARPATQVLVCALLIAANVAVFARVPAFDFIQYDDPLYVTTNPFIRSGLTREGFRWVFIVDGHGSPLHNRSLDQAGDYFHDTHGGRMVHLYGLQATRDCCREPLQRLLTEAERNENGFTVHAGAVEHSAILFLRPDLVPPGYRGARSWTGKDFPDLVRLARADDWPGYFGAPRLASAALGTQLYQEESQYVIATALRVLDGWDPSGETRYADAMFAATPVAVEALNPAIKEEDRRLARQRDWLARKARP